MKGSFFIALNNLKKKRSEGAVIFFMAALLALLLYTGISVLSGMRQVLDDCRERTHTADYMYMADRKAEEIEAILRAQPETAEYENGIVYNLFGVEYYKEGAEGAQMEFIIADADADRTIGLLEGYHSGALEKDGILLPYYLKSGEGLLEGDRFCLKIGDREYAFTVAGFVENPLMGTPLNISVYQVYVNHERMEEMAAESPLIAAAKCTEHRVRLREGESSADYDQKVSAILTRELPELSESALGLGLNWELMSGGVSMMPTICMGIILLFSALLMIVTLIVIRFSIRNFMEMNLKNTGILQAAGYTSGQLMLSVVLEMGLLAVLSILVGVLLGMAGSSVIGGFQGRLMGLRWTKGVDVPAAFLTAFLILGIVLGVSLICSGCYRRITVLNALRSGIHTHNFKKNYFSLESCPMPLSLVLSAKNLMQEKGKNLSIGLIVMLLSFVCCVGFGMYETFVRKPETFLKIAGIETGDLFVIGENLDAVGSELATWEEVEEVLHFNMATVTVENNGLSKELNCEVWRDPKAIHNELLIAGRHPEHDNEIVLSANVAKYLEAEAGDTIYVTGQGERLPYLVSGINQKMSEMGMRVLLSEDGMLRLNGANSFYGLYLYTKDIPYNEISGKILARFPEVTCTDSEKQTEAVMRTVANGVAAVCVIFVTITVLVVVLVELLLIKTRLIRERKHMGICKGIGYTTAQLIAQTILLNLPVIAAGAVIGGLAGNRFMGPAVVLCLSFSGITKCEFTVPVHWIFLTVFGIVGVALTVSFLSAVRIRKIRPVEMLTEE
ncbi:MAG: ABC transporter permease [Agathobacter sp.]|nr:ABC transporter permease [Agathobacter sp.]